ncbi:3-phosphoshikimate 1-carboxyvinyltransferase [Christensenellaceae bacterium OttesenSCG-928-M15]|nr:3-phosphoshikimate 1-carboxyvinyltransferase [Christensenellaceae bacterium OttesenSCG-928-M15]
MMIMCSSPAAFTGTIPAIISKSDAHRLLICAALSKQPTRLHMPGPLGEDINATIRCLTALGAAFHRDGDDVIVTPPTAYAKNPVFDCGESGSTLRFLLPVAAAIGCGGTFTGTGRLPDRPIAPLIWALEAGGISFDGDALPLRISGRLKSGEYLLPGNISSQFISGFLLALPLLEGGGEIRLTQTLESAGYVDMTLHALSRFSINVRRSAQAFAVEAQAYRSPGTLRVEGDWSNMAFFLAAGFLRGPIRLTGLSMPSLQGDSAIAGLLKQFGAEISMEEGVLSVSAGKRRSAIREIDMRPIPDLLPVLAVLAAVSEGKTRFIHAARLRLKESDRLKSVHDMILALGGNATIGKDFLAISGEPSLMGGTVLSNNDHRIAMAAAIAATVCDLPVTIFDAEAVNKSYPTFFEDYRMLGGIAHVVHDR